MKQMKKRATMQQVREIVAELAELNGNIGWFDYDEADHGYMLRIACKDGERTGYNLYQNNAECYNHIAEIINSYEAEGARATA